MSDDVDDEYVSQSELFDDIDDVYAAYGNDFSMGGTLAGELKKGIRMTNLLLIMLENGRRNQRRGKTIVYTAFTQGLHSMKRVTLHMNKLRKRHAISWTSWVKVKRG
jgi:hypothetical protein